MLKLSDTLKSATAIAALAALVGMAAAALPSAPAAAQMVHRGGVTGPARAGTFHSGPASFGDDRGFRGRDDWRFRDWDDRFGGFYGPGWGVGVGFYGYPYGYYGYPAYPYGYDCDYYDYYNGYCS